VCGSGVSCGRCEWCVAGRTNLCASYYTLGLQVDGGLAERVLAPAAICLTVPDGLDDSAAALAQPLAVALHAVSRSGVARGCSCAVLGAGGIGAFVVAAAAALAPTLLVAVDIAKSRLDRALELGATAVLDASGDIDIAAAIRDLTDGQGADVVIEASGSPRNPAQAVSSARRGGHVLLLGLQPVPSEIDLLSVTTRELDLHGSLAHVCSEDLPSALSLLVSTPLAKSVLDREIALGDLVEEGIKPLLSGVVQGKVVVDVRR
jgi:(R,R)-butanediol dehydrogenase/meso-butanediol dehydrogenase/diacetyl reductase